MVDLNEKVIETIIFIIVLTTCRRETTIETACFACDFLAETPSGFFWQFVRENKTICIIFEIEFGSHFK
jgi:hypothetical protein